MAEISYPVAGGSGVTDANYEKLMGPVVGSGRVAFGPSQTTLTTPLIFGDNSGRQVKALANQAALVRGFRWESGSTPPVLALDANTSGNPRLDLIVLRLDRTDFTVRLGKTNGTPGAIPAAPSPIQDAGTSGHWELPLATVRVSSSGTTGQPFIAAGDVTPLEWWVSPPSVIAKVGQLPPASHGVVLHQPDTGLTYRGVGNAWKLLGESGSRAKVTAYAGWTADSIYAQRINGWTKFEGFATFNASDRTAGQDIILCTLPAAYRPAQDLRTTCWMTPSQLGVVLIDASTGNVNIPTYPQAFPRGGQIVISDSWPSI